MGSMGLTLPQVGITPGTTWATMLNDALVPLVEEHDHSAGKGIFVKTFGLVGINVNGDLNFQDIDPISPTFGDYNRSVNLRSIRLNQLTPVASGGPFDTDTLTLMTDLTDLWYRDGAGTLIQLTDGGAPTGLGRRYGFQDDYDSLAPNAGYAKYESTFKVYDFGSDNLAGRDTLLTCAGVANSSIVSWTWSATVLGLATEAGSGVGSVRLGHLASIAAPNPASYAYPDLWAAEVAPEGASATQDGFRVQGNLAAPSGDPTDGPEHLDLTAYALNPPLPALSYWKDAVSATTPQLTTGDGVIAYWGNPRAAATTTDLFISGSYDHRNARFYDGIKLKGGGDVDIHIANGTPLSEFALRGGLSNTLTWSWYNGLGLGTLLMKMSRGGSLNDEFRIEQKGTGNMTLRTGPAAAIGIQIDDSQNIVMGNTATNWVASKGFKLDMAFGIDNTPAYLQIAPLRSQDGQCHLNFISSLPAGDYSQWGLRIVRYQTDDGVARIMQRGAGDFEIWTGDAIAPFKALAISSAQTTTLYGELYVNGGPAAKKIILGSGALSQPCGIEIGLNRDPAGAGAASFVDFTTELGGHDFDARIHRSDNAALADPGVFLIQNNGDKNILLRVGDPAAAVQTQREASGGAGIKTGAIGFDNEEVDPRELTSQAGFASDPNINCYDSSRAILNMQSIIMARARVLWNPLGGAGTEYSVGSNRWNFGTTVEQDATGVLRMSLLIPPRTNTTAPGTAYGDYDACYIVTAEQSVTGGDANVGSARQSLASAEEIEISLNQAGGAKVDCCFSIVVVGFPTVVP